MLATFGTHAASINATRKEGNLRRRNTRQRKLILDIVRTMNNHPTADEIFLVARERDPHIGRGTVYRNLNLLVDDGEIRMLKTPGGSRFDWRCDEHSHVLCTSCGTVADMPLAYDHALDARASSATGYAVASHYTFFEGLCPACLKRERPAEDPRKAQGATA